MKYSSKSLVLSSLVLVSQATLAGVIVDGGYTDWSIDPTTMVSADANTRYVVEDQRTSYLSPVTVVKSTMPRRCIPAKKAVNSILA